jgi:hypothetical protein
MIWKDKCIVRCFFLSLEAFTGFGALDALGAFEILGALKFFVSFGNTDVIAALWAFYTLGVLEAIAGYVLFVFIAYCWSGFCQQCRRWKTRGIRSQYFIRFTLCVSCICLADIVVEVISYHLSRSISLGGATNCH